MADQLWLMTCIREEEEEVVMAAVGAVNHYAN